MSVSFILRRFSTLAKTTRHATKFVSIYQKEYIFAVVGKKIKISDTLDYEVIDKCTNYTTGKKMVYVSVSRCDILKYVCNVKQNNYKIIMTCDEFEDMCTIERGSI